MYLLKWLLILLISQFQLIHTQNNVSTHGWNDARCGWSPVKNDEHRIFNGVNASQDEFPWMAKLFFDDGVMCGASIINRHWLITAAHCFSQYYIDNGMRVYVEVGTNSFSNGQRFYVPWNRVFRYFRFSNNGRLHYDIALIKTQDPMPVGSNSINTVCLPDDYEEPRSNSVVAIGWGLNENDRYPEWLSKVTLDIISDQECKNRYEGDIVPGELCTWTQSKDACSGDSGGPSVEYRGDRAYLIGVTSWGYGCADEYPGVSTQVSHFMPWIKWVLSFNY